VAVWVPVLRRGHEVRDREHPSIGQAAVGFSRDPEEILPVAQVKAESEDQQIELAVGERQGFRGSDRQAKFRMPCAPVLDGSDGRINTGACTPERGTQPSEFASIAAPYLEYRAGAPADVGQDRCDRVVRSILSSGQIPAEPRITLAGKE
jgi:hypothetical protein